MRKFFVPLAAFAAFTFVAVDAAPVQAQVIIGGGYGAPGYYGGYSYPSAGYGLGFNSSPLYSGYGGYPTYGYGYGTGGYYGNPGYRSSFYNGNRGYGSRGSFGGNRSFGGGRRR